MAPEGELGRKQLQVMIGVHVFLLDFFNYTTDEAVWGFTTESSEKNKKAYLF